MKKSLNNLLRAMLLIASTTAMAVTPPGPYPGAVLTYATANPSPTSSYGEFINYCQPDQYSLLNCWYKLVNPAYNTPADSPYYYLLNPINPPPPPPPPPPAPVACSGTNQVITSISSASGYLQVYNSMSAIRYPSQANITLAPGMTTFAVGNVIQYSGFLDQVNTFCVADTMSVTEALVFGGTKYPTGTVNSLYPDSTVNFSGGVAPFTVDVLGLPPGLVWDGNVISGTPTAVGSYSISLSVTDGTGQHVSYNTGIVINPEVVAQPACAGSNEIITQINPRQGSLFTATGAVPVIFPSQANTVLAPGMTTFVIGNVIQYSGIMDLPGVFCVADTMSVSEVLSVNPIAYPDGIVNGMYPITNVNVVGGIAPYMVGVTGLPGGLTFDGTAISGIPTTAGLFGIAIDVVDGTGQQASGSASILIKPAPTPPPAPVTTCPATGVKADGKGVVSAFNSSSVTTKSGVVVKYLPCTKISWGGTSKAFKAGDSIEWKGYRVNGSIVATKITVN